MPIFEFICDHCSKTFELLAVRTEDQVPTVCPYCQSPEISRALSRVNLGARSSSGEAASLPSVDSRNCAGGSCTTINIPGPTK
ncbi:MAG: zinc ribbon domain-containing protein [Desulfobacterota bacterium]|nr:zinc ribbon domain-containing protein [Thermodesulfobacteriota bacterium]